MGARRLLSVASALLVGLAGLGACTSDETPPSPKPSSPSPTTPETSGSASAVQIVVARDGDLWLYTVQGDAFTRLTTDGADSFEQQPRFRPGTNGTVSFFVNASDGKGGNIFDVDPTTKKATRIVPAAPVRTLGWSPNGDALAYVAGLDDTEGVWVYLFDPVSKASRRIKRLPACASCGRGIADLDERRVSWSPDGSKILIVDTTLDNDPGISMFVFDRSGKDVVPARAGTQARWSADGGAIYYEQTDPLAKANLKALDVATNKLSSLPVTGGVRFAVSPDAKFLAYDDGKVDSVFLLDLTSKAKRKLAAGALGALWLDDDAIVVTEVRACRADECGDAPPWMPTGSTLRVSLAGERTGLSLQSTIDADVRRTAS